MSEIVLDGVTKVFNDGYEAVKDMNLDIGDGEFMISGNNTRKYRKLFNPGML